MDVESVEYYSACDKAIRAMDRSNLEAFGQLKMAKWDKINVIKTVVAVYQKSAKEARKRYYEVAFEGYLLMMALCGVPPKKAHQMAEKSITEHWVDDVLKQTDFVTLYRFDSETERKAYRLAETLEVSTDRDAEINKALRAWVQQLAQYAINMTDYAMLQAMDDAGIKEAEWVSVADERRCGECRSLDGRVFKLDEFPAKPHMRCRCRMRPILQKKEEE